MAKKPTKRTIKKPAKKAAKKPTVAELKAEIKRQGFEFENMNKALKKQSIKLGEADAEIYKLKEHISKLEQNRPFFDRLNYLFTGRL